MLRDMFCLAATVLFTHAASANVLYTWQQLEHSPSVPDGLHLELVFTDAAVAAGTLSVTVANFCQVGQVCEAQQEGLVALRYWYDDPVDDRRLNFIDYRYRDETRFGRQQIEMRLQFLPEGYLSGSIMANDSNSDFSFASSGRIFTMLSAHSDEPWACGFAYPHCGGERGVLRVEGHPVPEPAAPASLAIGALAGWLARRRRPGRVKRHEYG